MAQINNNRVSVLVSSCDSYSDLWDPFFLCIERFSKGNVPYPFYLNTEHARYEYNGNVTLTVINQLSEKQISWSKRMLDALKRIPEQYVFLLLDDFYACDTICWDKFEEILDKMDGDPNIASVQMYGTRVRNKSPENYEVSDSIKYRVMEPKGWKTHFVPTIWRKDVLMRWLRPWETIWAFESCGSARARRWHYPEDVLVIDNPPIYDYLWIKDCSAVINGKWLGEPELSEFFEKNEIPVDYSKRGKLTYEEYKAITMKEVVKRYTLPQIIVKAFNRFRSLF